jgi:long-chain fatty acid transport protein
LPQGADGFADLQADNFSSPAFGFNFSLLYEINNATRVGLAYRSEITIDVDGTADFSVPSIAAAIPAGTGAFVDTGIKGSIDLPQSLSISVAHEMDKMTLLGDISWTGWSSFSELRIVYDNPAQPDSVTTEAWDDSLRYSVGLDFQYSDDMILRGGLAYDETPIPNANRRTPRVPGNSRRWLSFGLSYMIDTEFTVDVGYSHLFISDTAINNTFESSLPKLNGTIDGTYTASVDILSAQLRWNY